MSLHPTKTRLALLRNVEAGDVIEGITDETSGHSYLIPEVGASIKVTARIIELERAGWVELPDDLPVIWRLTDAGRAMLEASDG